MNEMRYALFAGDNYYPAGGIEDLRGRFATHFEAQQAFDAGWKNDGEEQYDWGHIVDLETFEVIEDFA